MTPIRDFVQKTLKTGYLTLAAESNTHPMLAAAMSWKILMLL